MTVGAAVDCVDAFTLDDVLDGFDVGGLVNGAGHDLRCDSCW